MREPNTAQRCSAILEAVPEFFRNEKASHLCKALILLTILAPRPGLEPGTYGLTGYRSICPLTRMNASFPGFSLPIFLVRFTSGRPGNGGSEPLDIGSLDLMVPRRMMIAPRAVLRALPPRCKTCSGPQNGDIEFVSEACCVAPQPRWETTKGKGGAPFAGMENSMMTNWERRIDSAPQCRLAGPRNQQADLSKRPTEGISPIGIEC